MTFSKFHLVLILTYTLIICNYFSCLTNGNDIFIPRTDCITLAIKNEAPIITEEEQKFLDIFRSLSNKDKQKHLEIINILKKYLVYFHQI